MNIYNCAVYNIFSLIRKITFPNICFFYSQMSKNEIASTLFRFVSLRNPEPPLPEEVSIKYVSRPEEIQLGYFESAVRNRDAGVTKEAAMNVAADKFKDAFLKAEQVSETDKTLYDFSNWLIKNRTSATNDEFEAQVAKVLKTLDLGIQARLWDNLVYQTITSKSFYVKEALMQMILGNHVVLQYRKGDKERNKLVMQARVALPSELFTDDEVTETSQSKVVGVNYPEAPDAEKERFIAKSRAEFSNVQSTKLLKEIEKLEAVQKKDYNRAYETARQDYNKKYQPVLEEYHKAVEDARKAYCEVRNPEIEYNENDPCQQPQAVPYPDIPNFEFEFNNELDWDTLKNKLTPESYSVLAEAYSVDQDISSSSQSVQRLAFSESSAPSSVTYSEVSTQVNQLVSLNNHQIQQNTIVTSPQVTVGGVVLPASPINIEPLFFDDRYSVLHVNSGLTKVYSIWFFLEQPVNVTKVEITQHNSDGTTNTFTKNAPSLVTNGSRSELNNIFTYTLPLGLSANTPTFDFDLYLASGEIKKIKGIAASHEYGIRGYFETSGSSGSDTIDNTPKAFVPSGFGFKQLGIADYLKVEQSVHCYVEGEVSHIENVMAREYKEKSTRRLARTEETTTSTSETERENLTDTSTTDRFEMQSEVASVISESQDMSGFVNTGYSYSGFHIDAGLGFANNSSSENSSNYAVTKAQEVTERAMDRIVSRMKQERIRKVMEEFEENNKHGYDNREGDSHVVGVYRWVDKLYKNQIFNYGRRLMFEFMIPEPARLHLLGMEPDVAISNGTTILTAPADPRKTGGSMAVPGYLSLDENKASYWAAQYNADIEAKPEANLSVGESFFINLNGGSTLADVECNSGNGKVTIPEGYKAVSASGIFNAVSDNKGGRGRLLSLTVGNYTRTTSSTFGAYSLTLDTAQSYGASAGVTVGGSFSTFQIGNEVPVSYTLGNHVSGDISVTVKCQLTDEALNSWKQRTFNAIMEAYEEKLAEYNEKLEQEKNIAIETKKTNPGFYRQMENTILRKNCISYLIDQNPNAKNTYGKGMFRGSTFTDYEINVNQGLSDYAAFVKFIEQAFEWNIMSYNFYPYYWASRNTWKDKYQFDDSTDPLFRNFIQAGMAQVIVTVKPGFEEAVYHYLKTGKIWNGGEVPVIGDDMYMDIVSQVRTIPAEPVGKAWITRLPTDLTILQADSIGLKVEKALPCNCDDTADFENPEAIPCSDGFEINQNQLGGAPGETTA